MEDIRGFESRLRRASPRSKEQKRINCLQEGTAGHWEALAARSCALTVEISRWQLWVHQISESSVELCPRRAMHPNCSQIAFSMCGCQSGGRTGRVRGSLGSELLRWFLLGPCQWKQVSRDRIGLEQGENHSRQRGLRRELETPASHKTGHGQVHVSKSQRNNWFLPRGSGSGWCLNHWARFLALPFLVFKGPRS